MESFEQSLKIEVFEVSLPADILVLTAYRFAASDLLTVNHMKDLLSKICADEKGS